MRINDGENCNLITFFLSSTLFKRVFNSNWLRYYFFIMIICRTKDLELEKSIKTKLSNFFFSFNNRKVEKIVNKISNCMEKSSWSWRKSVRIKTIKFNTKTVEDNIKKAKINAISQCSLLSSCWTILRDFVFLF